MVERKDDGPDVITHAIPRFEVYEVSDDELMRIEEGSTQVAQDFAFMLASLSLCIAFLIGLATGTFSETIGMTLRAAAAVFGISAIYTGWRWVRRRKTAPDVIDSIRSRRVNPEA